MKPRLLPCKLLSRTPTASAVPRLNFLRKIFNQVQIQVTNANRASQAFADYFQHPTFRAFSTTPWNRNWLVPRRGHTQKNRKGRCRVPTGGSTRGTTLVMGDYGLRMRDHDRRVSASQLSIGAEAIKKRLRGQKYRLYTRVCANIGVYTSGNESRMGKGKGSFDYWASRIAVSKIIFELKGDLHEQIVRDAFRLAANKLPGKPKGFF